MKFDIAFCLSFDVQKDNRRKSGFAPAWHDLGAKKALFGQARLEGFAALARLRIAEKLVILGGDEGRYKEESPPINRAWAIKQMLLYDFGISEGLLDFAPSNSNTGGNLAAMNACLKQTKPNENCLVSSFYHLPRIQHDLFLDRKLIPCFPAEVFILLEDESRKSLLISLLGGGLLAERIAEEIQGIAHKIKGIYQPKTDVKPT